MYLGLTLGKGVDSANSGRLDDPQAIKLHALFETVGPVQHSGCARWIWLEPGLGFCCAVLASERGEGVAHFSFPLVDLLFSHSVQNSVCLIKLHCVHQQTPLSSNDWTMYTYYIHWMEGFWPVD